MKSFQGTAKVTVKIESTNRVHVVSSELGDPHSSILQVNISKDLSSPTGTWNIVFAPVFDKDKKSWFDMVEVWDYVEIKLKGVFDEKEKVVMRGMIDNISKSESYEGGTPNISISMSGRDFGSLFMDFQILYIPELDPMAAKLKAAAWKPSPPFMTDAKGAMDFILDRWGQMIDLSFGFTDAQQGPGVPLEYGKQLQHLIDRRVECMYPKNQTNVVSYLNTYEGPYWNALLNYQDKPWHEIFLYDRDDKTYVVMRPSRYKDVLGGYPARVTELMGSDFLKSKDAIMYPNNSIISEIEKISIDVGKNGNEIFNYFFSFPLVQLVQKTPYRMAALAEVLGNPEKSINPYFALDVKYPSYVGKFGIRKYEATTIFADMDVGMMKNLGENRGKDYDTAVVRRNFLDKGKEMNEMLVAWFLHNQYLLSGSMNTVGNTRTLIGTYIRDEGDGMEYYVEGVTHNFVALDSYKTTFRLSRGQPSASKGGLGKDKNPFNFSGQSSGINPDPMTTEKWIPSISFTDKTFVDWANKASKE